MKSRSSIYLLFIIFLTLSLSAIEGYDVLAKFTGDYFKKFYVSQIVVFGCWENHISVAFSKSIMKNTHNKLMYVNINDNLNLDKLLKVDYWSLGIVLDLDCQRSQIIFDQFSEQNLRHNESYFWLMPTSKEKIPDYFHKLPLNIANEMTLAVRKNNYLHNSNNDTNNNNISYILYDVYNPSYRHGGKLNVTYMGHWSLNDRDKGTLTISLTQYKYKRRGNLYGLVLNASIVVDHPPVPDYNTYIHNPINPHLDTMHRYNYALTLQLRDYYNFTMNLKRGTTWGYLINGTFNGIIGDMMKGLVDFGATPFQYKPERLDAIEYTVQAWMARPCFIFRHPTTNELSNPFLKPFEMKVWYVIAIFAAVNWIFLYTSVKLEHKLVMKQPVCTLDTYPASEIIMITTSAICQQGLSDGPRFYAGRIVFIFLFIWGFLLYQFYSASIVGSLLAGKPKWINTLQDLADSNLEVGIEDIAYNYDFFATTTDPVAQQLYREKVAVNKKRKREPYYTIEEGLQRMQKGGFAFHVDVATAYKIIEETFDVNEICDLVEIQLFPPKHTATATARFSPFKKMVTYGLRQVVEHGMARRLRNVWMHRRPECPESHKDDPVPIMITEFSPALFLMSCGWFVSMCIVIGEKLAMKKQEIGEIRDGDAGADGYEDPEDFDRQTASTNSQTSRKSG
ncbi:ionotropic receptor 75a-like [Microplitis mediator]|uniref:ionotropic receptor 75a-like n=1 Tax=Microplitis mediator TaxID=375433 RepID=UPI0025550517|nr:ionotropic receptor 75a-like [Microplitis mediator]